MFWHVVIGYNLLWPLCVADADIIFCPVVSSIFCLFSFLAYSQPPQTGCLPYFHTWCGLSASLGCRSEMCCRRLAANTGRKNSPCGHHHTTLLGYIFATEAHIDNQKKNLLNSNISPTCPYNMVNFGPLTAEVCWRVWDISANFNGFRVLAALLHGTLLVGVSQTAALNKRPIRQGGHHFGHWPTF